MDIKYSWKELLRDYTRFIGFLFLLFLNVTGAKGQFYEYGQDAGSIRWSELSSDHYQVIYPRGMDSLAFSFADKLEYFYPHQAAQMKHEHAMMPVVIHHEASFSNGVFVWAPKRLEVFSNPDPNAYPQEWMTQLALHEGRHAFQVSKLNQGLSKGLSYVFGEQIVGAITGYLPMWYLEGDAVDAETRFSYSGRGRQPSFEMGLKAIALEEGLYPFSKALIGSYKDYIPNHYELGYLMVHYGRKQYGAELWNDMEDYTARRPWSVFPSYFSLRKSGVTSKQDLYKEALGYYQEHWDSTSRMRTIDDAEEIAIEKSRHYTSYRFPHWESDSLVIALKSGIDMIPEFVRIDASGKEERIFRPGYQNSGRFSYRNGLLVWEEWLPDIRWSNRNYSQINLYNTHTSTLSKLGHQTRYYAPALSKNAGRIAAIEQSSDHNFYLVLMDLKGSVQLREQCPGTMFLQHPTWMENDSALVLIANSEDGERLVKYSLQNGEWTELYDSGYDDISFPMVEGERIYFSSTRSGIDNIHAFDMTEKQEYMLSSARFGAFDPQVSKKGDRVLYSAYHADGYRPAVLGLDEHRFVPVEELPDIQEQMDALPDTLEKRVVDGSLNLKPGTYEVKPYRKLRNAVNIHSWSPFYFDYMNYETALNFEQLPVSLGATVLTQNLLSTVTGIVGLEYKKEEGLFWHSGFRFQGRVPVLDVSVERGGSQSQYMLRQDDEVVSNASRWSLNAKTYIPLRFNTGRFLSIAQPMLSYRYTNDVLPSEDGDFYESGMHAFTGRLYAASYLRMNKRDILPRFGGSFSWSRTAYPFDNHNLGSLETFYGTVYLPGFLKHQTIKASYQHWNENQVRFLHSAMSMNPRGRKKALYGETLHKYSIDFTLPLAYPDWNIEGVLYLTRIRANLWFDHVLGEEVRINEELYSSKSLRSFGFDLISDLHPIRLGFETSPGIRMSYLPETQSWVPELLFSIEID